jgi:hypothetical protein
MLAQRFHAACKRHGLNQRNSGSPLNTARFTRPPAPGDQLPLSI